MKGFGQFYPVTKMAEIIAERWTPLIRRELCDDPRRFNDLNDLPRALGLRHETRAHA